MNPVVISLGIIVLIISTAATGLAGYTFFVVFPPVASGMTIAANDLAKISGDLRYLANQVPCIDGCAFVVPPLKFIRDGIWGIADPIDNLAYTTIAFRNRMYYGIITMMGLGLAGIFSGVAFIETGKALQKRVIEQTAR